MGIAELSLAEVQAELNALLAEMPEVSVDDFIPGADLEASRRPMTAEEAASLCEKGDLLCQIMERPDISDRRRNLAFSAVTGILTRLKRERLPVIGRANHLAGLAALTCLAYVRSESLRSYADGKLAAAAIAEERELMSV